MTATEPSTTAGGPSDSLVGRVLSDRYRLLRCIGEGGIGRVYLADHIGTGRVVALKVLLGELADNAPLVDTFLEEARTVSRLGHQNIIDIYYGGRTSDGLAFLVMEHLTGMDLADALRLGGPMPWERARSIFVQAASALGTVHANGLIHGDIKPANLFLVNDRERRDFVKILDFGVAKAMGTGQRGAAVEDDDQIAILGTPQYIAPEQALARAVDGRADVYALGCVMYRTLTGSVPFSADNPIDLMAKHVYEPPQPMRERRPDLDISSSLDGLVLRAMRKDPAQRFATMDEMGEAIMRCRFASTTMPIASAPSSQFRLRDGVVERKRMRRTRRAAVMVAAGLFAVGAMLSIARALAPGRIQVTAQPADSVVLLDSRLRAERTPIALDVPRGQHEVRVWRRGYVSQSQSIYVGARETRQLDFKLSVSPDTGLEITSEPPGALIFLDGQPLYGSPGVQAQTNYRALRIAPGHHVIELRSSQGVWRQEVDVQPDRIVPVHGSLPAYRAPRSVARARRTFAMVP